MKESALQEVETAYVALKRGEEEMGDMEEPKDMVSKRMIKDGKKRLEAVLGDRIEKK